jgi:hypothetical protein
LGNRIAFFNVNLSNFHGTYLAILDLIPARNGNDSVRDPTPRAAIRRRQDG